MGNAAFGVMRMIRGDLGREVFGSKFAFVAAAVGTANMWRCPWVAAEWRGGSFLIVLVIANLVWVVPILVAESCMGSESQLGAIGAVRDLTDGK